MLHRIATIALMTTMVMSVFAAKIDLETGGKCVGPECADIEIPRTPEPKGSAGCLTPPFKTLPGATPAYVAAGSDESLGTYRVPYEAGTKVYISHDFDGHSPPGKIDMIGGGAINIAGNLNSLVGGSYRVVAAADGEIACIVDHRKESQNPELAKSCYNNYVWIRHANGEWSKYSHMKQYSTTKKAGLKIGDFVKAGTYLGDQGSVGCSWPAHLHFEVVVPSQATPVIDANDGSMTGVRRDPVMCGIDSRVFQGGKTYEAVVGPGEVQPGADEVIRHGMPINNYLCFLRHGSAAGYQLSWVDFFDIDGDLHVNAVMRPKTTAWQSRSAIDGDGLKSENQKLKESGYHLTQLESYIEHRDIQYAGIWEQGPGPAQKFYYGFSATEHQKQVETLKKQGYRPRNISVVSHSSGLKYAAIWEKVSSGWALRSGISASEYREKSREYRKQGLEVAYLNAYVHKGQAYLSAIWTSSISSDVRRRTDLGKKELENEWNAARKLQLTTAALTAYEVNGPAKYTAVFSE